MCRPGPCIFIYYTLLLFVCVIKPYLAVQLYGRVPPTPRAALRAHLPPPGAGRWAGPGGGRTPAGTARAGCGDARAGGVHFRLFITRYPYCWSACNVAKAVILLPGARWAARLRRVLCAAVRVCAAVRSAPPCASAAAPPCAYAMPCARHDVESSRLCCPVRMPPLACCMVNGVLCPARSLPPDAATHAPLWPPPMSPHSQAQPHMYPQDGSHRAAPSQRPSTHANPSTTRVAALLIRHAPTLHGSSRPAPAAALPPPTDMLTT